jgi:hypothetical protein
LDADLVQEFLAQLEEGVYSSVDVTDERTGEGTAGGKITVGPLQGQLGGQRGTRSGERYTVQQTSASEFQRLYAFLSEKGSVQTASGFDGRSWAKVKRGSIIELDGVVRLSGLSKLFAGVQQLAAVTPLLGTADPEAAANLANVAEMAKAVDSAALPVVVRAASTPTYAFVASLDRERIRVPQHLLEGEATLFAKVQRILADGEELQTQSLFPGLGPLDKAFQEGVESSTGENPELEGLLGEFSISGPGAVLTPIGLYR